MNGTTRIVCAVGASLALAMATVPATADSLGTTGGVHYATSSAPLPGTSPPQGEVRARCPKGWKPVSGGATIANGSTRALSSLGKGGPRYWYADAWQTSGTATTLRGYVVCLQTDSLTRADSSMFNVPAGPVQVADTATCASGHVVGGGSIATGTNTNWTLNSSLPIDDDSDADTVRDNAWHVYYNYTGPGGDDLLTHALCLGGPRPTYKHADKIVPAHTSRTVRAACPAGTHVIGGSAYVDGEVAFGRVSGSRPYDSGDAKKVPDDGWETTITNTSDGELQETSYAICR